MTHEVLTLFPTLVSLALFEKAADFNPRARQRIAELRDQPGGMRSPGQWQSRHDLHTDPVFKDLVDFIVKATNDHFGALSYKSTPLAITGFWANINEPGFQHATHSHPNNFVSGVYYVTAPENAGGLVFHDPRKQHIVLAPTVTQWTALNSTKARLPAVEGRAVLFPSWLEHYTESNDSDVARISIAFNLMLTGGFGSPETYAGGYIQP